MLFLINFSPKQKFNVDNLIGRGSYAYVYRVKDRKTQKPYVNPAKDYNLHSLIFNQFSLIPIFLFTGPETDSRIRPIKGRTSLLGK